MRFAPDMQSEAKVHATAVCESLTRCSCRCSTDVGARSAPQAMIALLDRIVRCATRPGPQTCRQTCRCLSMPMNQHVLPPEPLLLITVCILLDQHYASHHPHLTMRRCVGAAVPACGAQPPAAQRGGAAGIGAWWPSSTVKLDAGQPETQVSSPKHVLAGLLRDHPDTSSHMTTHVSELYDTSLAG